MHFGDPGVTGVFNGEIYNHHDLRKRVDGTRRVAWKGSSDTESLLASVWAFGIEATIAASSGMFALAIYDNRSEELLLARDRAGEKPLYYRLDRSGIVFASELKALLLRPGASRRIDEESLDCYLGMGYVPGDRCILKGYGKLPPAHLLRFSVRTGQSHVSRYWDLPTVTTNATASRPEELCRHLESTLSDAVRAQLVADVPVGVLLSGGLDSSIVTSLATRHARRVRTFSVGFPGHERIDETRHARRVAEYLGTEHTELQIESAPIDAVPDLARQFDEPLADSSMIPTFMVCRLVRQHCKVALGGDGGDELFGGYGYYQRLLRLERARSAMPAAIRTVISRMAGALPASTRGRKWLTALRTDEASRLPPVAFLFDRSERELLLRGSGVGSGPADRIHRNMSARRASLVDAAMRTDFTAYLPDDILVKVDRASMLCSLEVRAPFLDRSVVEFAYSRVPMELKVTGGSRKVLLRMLARGLLPPDFDTSRKQGFSVPLREWLSRGRLRELLLDSTNSSGGLFDRKAVWAILHRPNQGLATYEGLFALLMFELWRAEYGTSL